MRVDLAQAAGERHALIPAGRVALEATVHWPASPAGVVLFVHGSGSSRLSPRNQLVAHRLVGAGFATLQFDLLTRNEAADRHNVFDIPLLTDRLLEALRWAEDQVELAGLPVGLFGASTGAAAALIAAAKAADRVQAVVSRGGRPDLAGVYLPMVIAPTLLLVGGNDPEVLKFNRESFAHLFCPRELVVVPRATHLFAEPGALEEVAELAAGWFRRHLITT